MDRDKASSNYSAAYKMRSRTGENKTSQRLRRRSVEQKQQRNLEVDKRRRPLAGLTPLEEEQNIQDVSYRDKTPLRRKADKENSLLQRLQKWKEERAHKRAEEAKTKKDGFRVSRNVDRRDNTLYQSLKVGKMSKAAPISRVPEKAGPTTTRAATKKQTKLSPSQVKLASARHASRSRVVTAPEPRVTRHSARVRDQEVSKTCQLSTRPAAKTRASRKPEVTVPKPALEPKQPIVNETMINTRRGLTMSSEESSFAPSDFTFDASSFVFTPLSPTSSANFLNPGQSTSFMQTRPELSSTPKESRRPKRASRGSQNVATSNQEDKLPRLESISESGTVLSSSTNPGHDMATLDAPEMTSTDCNANVESGVTEDKDRMTPSRRRTSRASSVVVDKEAVSLTPDRCSSVSGAGQSVDEAVVSASLVSTPVSTGKSARRRSLRQSLLQAKVPHVDVDLSEDPPVKAADGDRENAEIAVSNTSSHVESPKKRRRVSSQATDDEQTPSRQQRRRSSRRSLATPRVEIIPEAALEEHEPVAECMDNTALEKTSAEVNMHGKSLAGSSGHDMTAMQGSSCRTAGLRVVSNQKTPTSTRNKSFGGFRLPDSGAAVLSSSARRRTANRPKTPKSPEEWVEILSNSPMVEMSRRKPKLGNMSLPALKFDELDDVDFDDADQVAQLEKSICSQSSEVETSSSSSDEGTSSQLAEVTSGQSEEKNEDNSGEHDVPYFRNLMISETKRLNEHSAYWELMNATLKLSEEVQGQIRTTVGQAQLLMDQRFKQFSGLVDNCEFNTGEKETTCMDLQGFWDMVYYQVEDVDAKFEALKKLQGNNWVDDKPKPAAVKPLKKKFIKPVTKKPVAGRSKFAAFRNQMKKQKEGEAGSSSDVTETVEKKTFEIPGFFQVTSPVRSPKPHCAAGSPAKVPTPACAPEIPSAPSSGRLSGTHTPLRRSYAPIVASPLLIDSTPKACTTRTESKKTPIPRRLSKIRGPPSMDSNDDKDTKRTPRRSIHTRKSVHFPEDSEMVSFKHDSLTASDANESVTSQDSSSPSVETSSVATSQRRSTRNKSRPSLLYTPPKQSTCAVTPSKDIPTGVLISFSP